jgi:hypothetical protein
MSNEVATQSNNQVALPQHLAALFAGKSNLVPTDTTPSLTYKGKTFSVNINGAHKQLLDADGNPLPMVEVIILNANPRRSRTFFAGKFTENEGGKAPDCSSYDGKRPANEVEEPQSPNCETCPQAVKGSKINDKGQPVTACQLRQRIVVVPSDKPDFEALLVNMASTSAFDKDGADQNLGWFALDQYKKELSNRGIPHTAAVKTKIRFAPSDAFPRLQFKFAGLLDEAAMVVAAGRIESEEVMTLLNKDYNKPPVEHKTIAAPAAQPEVPVAAFGAVSDPDPQPAAKAAPKPAVAPVAPVADKPEPAAQPAKPAAVKPVVVESETDLNSILSAWD